MQQQYAAGNCSGSSPGGGYGLFGGLVSVRRASLQSRGGESSSAAGARPGRA